MKLIGAFGHFLTGKHAADPDFPSSLSKLKTDGGIQLQIAPERSLNNPRMAPYRVVLYVVGDVDALKNGLALL